MFAIHLDIREDRPGVYMIDLESSTPEVEDMEVLFDALQDRAANWQYQRCLEDRRIDFRLVGCSEIEVDMRDIPATPKSRYPELNRSRLYRIRPALEHAFILAAK